MSRPSRRRRLAGLRSRPCRQSSLARIASAIARYRARSRAAARTGVDARTRGSRSRGAASVHSFRRAKPKTGAPKSRRASPISRICATAISVAARQPNGSVGNGAARSTRASNDGAGLCPRKRAIAGIRAPLRREGGSQNRRAASRTSAASGGLASNRDLKPSESPPSAATNPESPATLAPCKTR